MKIADITKHFTKKNSLASVSFVRYILTVEKSPVHAQAEYKFSKILAIRSK